jgi:hypothetical protein
VGTVGVAPGESVVRYMLVWCFGRVGKHFGKVDWGGDRSLGVIVTLSEADPDRP